MSTNALLPVQLEGGVIGALLCDPNRLHDLPAGFKAEHLNPGLNRRVFVALSKLVADGKPLGTDLTPMLAAEARLSDQEQFRVAALVGDSAGPALPTYAAKLMDRRRREQLRAAATGAVEALGKGDETDATVSALMAQIFGLDQGERQEVTSLREASVRFMDNVEAVKTGKAPRVRTGFEDIDKALFVRPGNFVVIAARAGEGKTTFGLQFAGNVARSKKHVLLFSLEMTADEIVAVNLAREARMDSRRFFDEDSAIDWERVMQAADSLIAGTDGFLHISDQHYGLGEILRIAEKYHRRLGLSLVMVDYLQLVEAELGRGANRENHVAAVSRGLKKLAQRLGVPVVAMAQLNREFEKRTATPAAKRGRNKAEPEFKPAPPPKLIDLRESGAIEQDANAVCFIHNPFKESPSSDQRIHGPYDFVIAKQRMGPKGIAVRLRADFERSAFKPYAASVVPGGWNE